MQFLKKHWFGLIVLLILSFFILVSTLVLISPRQDAQKRGFISCTENLKEDLVGCENMFCTFKTIMGSSICDSKVVIKGFNAWAKGAQTTPWENYLFEPSLEPEDEGVEEFYQQNPNLIKEMNELKQKHKELENGQEE